MISKANVAVHLETKTDPNFLCGFRLDSPPPPEDKEQDENTSGVDIPCLEFDNNYLSDDFGCTNPASLNTESEGILKSPIECEKDDKGTPYFDQLMGELGGSANFDELERVMGVLRKICRNYTDKSLFNHPATKEAKDAYFKQLKAELHSQPRDEMQRVIHRLSDVGISSSAGCKVTIEAGKLGINVYETPIGDPARGFYSVTFNRFSGTSNAESQAAGRMHAGMVMTHVNGVSQRGLDHKQVLSGLGSRPCVMHFLNPTFLKLRTQNTQGNVRVWKRQSHSPIRPKSGGFGTDDVSSEFVKPEPGAPEDVPQKPTTAMTKAYQWISSASSASASRLLLGVNIHSSDSAGRKSRRAIRTPKKFSPEDEADRPQWERHARQPATVPLPNDSHQHMRQPAIASQNHDAGCYCDQCLGLPPTLSPAWKRARGRSTDDLVALDLAAQGTSDGGGMFSGRARLGEGRRVRSNSNSDSNSE
jgi:hypothetical protein